MKQYNCLNEWKCQRTPAWAPLQVLQVWQSNASCCCTLLPNRPNGHARGVCPAEHLGQTVLHPTEHREHCLPNGHAGLLGPEQLRCQRPQLQLQLSSARLLHQQGCLQLLGRWRGAVDSGHVAVHGRLRPRSRLARAPARRLLQHLLEPLRLRQPVLRLRLPPRRQPPHRVQLVARRLVLSRQLVHLLPLLVDLRQQLVAAGLELGHLFLQLLQLRLCVPRELAGGA
mmetsp:Transcript_2503/g.6434  ORF Transcript_2503/g.6434 Transcript_2503/m.6434 type:complete len:227 (+) Transcript_2503:112-792(+)